jgi:hypothetical protein
MGKRANGTNNNSTVCRHRSYTRGEINGVGRHNKRELPDGEYGMSKVDFDRSNQNYELHRPGIQKGTFLEEWDLIKERERLGGQFKRKGDRERQSKEMGEVILGASPEFLAELSKEEKRLCFEDAYEWGCKFFGKQFVISSEVHNDESTPHMQLCYVPVKLDADGNPCSFDKQGRAKISMSEKWHSEYDKSNDVPMLAKNGKPLLGKDGKPRMKHDYDYSYAKMQESYLNYMRDCGWDLTYEKGTRASQKLKLQTVLDYSVQTATEKKAEIESEVKSLENERALLDHSVQAATEKKAEIDCEVEGLKKERSQRLKSNAVLFHDNMGLQKQKSALADDVADLQTKKADEIENTAQHKAAAKKEMLDASARWNWALIEANDHALLRRLKMLNEAEDYKTNAITKANTETAQHRATAMKQADDDVAKYRTTEKEKADTEVQAIKDNIEPLQTQHDGLVASVADLQAREASSKAAIRKLKASASLHTKRVGKLPQEFADAKLKIDDDLSKHKTEGMAKVKECIEEMQEKGTAMMDGFSKQADEYSKQMSKDGYVSKNSVLIAFRWMLEANVFHPVTKQPIDLSAKLAIFASLHKYGLKDVPGLVEYIKTFGYNFNPNSGAVAGSLQGPER